MKAIFRALMVFFVGECAFVHAADNRTLPNFSDYSVDVYHGTLKIPNYYKKVDGAWRDDWGKMVSPIGINFAGKYYIGTHSCGGGCRYYTLSNLVSGSESNALDMFSNDERRSQKTSDGRNYVTSLVSQPNSKMLVAQYHIDRSAISEEECRERIFYLSDDGKEVRPITKTVNFCDERH
ncbi:hypothetical protein OKW43_006004 [Paraburkholderia sp. WC7.3g]|uniref:hypothetical protein n=1 Tax=Paraburkholderia sp. WC7.3g TaxID=2991070 RepID=UPI003D22F557